MFNLEHKNTVFSVIIESLVNLFPFYVEMIMGTGIYTKPQPNFEQHDWGIIFSVMKSNKAFAL
jgi:hypothetical protein